MSPHLGMGFWRSKRRSEAVLTATRRLAGFWEVKRPRFWSKKFILAIFMVILVIFGLLNPDLLPRARFRPRPPQGVQGPSGVFFCRFLAQKTSSDPRGVILRGFEKIDFLTIFDHYHPHTAMRYTPIYPLFGCCSTSNGVFGGQNGLPRPF